MSQVCNETSYCDLRQTEVERVTKVTVAVSGRVVGGGRGGSYGWVKVPVNQLIQAVEPQIGR